MLYFAILFAFLALFMFLYGILFLLNKNRLQLMDRVQHVNEIGQVKIEEDQESFSQRAIRPLYEAINGLWVRLTPKQKMRNLSKRLEAAGLLKNSTVEKWLYKSNMLIIIISTLVGLLVYLLDTSMATALLMTLLVTLLMNVIMRFYISSNLDKRRRNIVKDLPFTLDLITVSVEAGLSFDGAIARVINNIPGELSDEFAKMLKETKMGIERKIALRNMSERCDIKELSMFIASLIQADSLGVSLGNILRIESAQMRERRKQSAREKAMKAPIKMMFPLIIFIFPAIFVIILGPAAIKMMQMFGG